MNKTDIEQIEREFEEIIDTNTQLLLTNGDSVWLRENKNDIEVLKSHILSVAEEQYQKGREEALTTPQREQIIAHIQMEEKKLIQKGKEDRTEEVRKWAEGSRRYENNPEGYDGIIDTLVVNYDDLQEFLNNK